MLISNSGVASIPRLISAPADTKSRSRPLVLPLKVRDGRRAHRWRRARPRYSADGSPRATQPSRSIPRATRSILSTPPSRASWTARQTRDLPLNGRDWTTLATLNTGVSQVLTQFPGAATATTRLSRGLGAQLTIGGNRPQQNSYRLDGVNINDYANGGPGSVSGATLGVDAVQEFNVITSDAPAQYGRMSGGVVNSITRQGTNQFHGSAYDFHPQQRLRLP